MIRPKGLRALAATALASLFVVALPTAAGAGVITYDTAVTLTDGLSTAVPGTTSVYTLTVAHVSGDSGPIEVSPTFSQGEVTSWSCVPSGGGACGSSNTPGPVQDLTNIQPGVTLTYTINLAIPSSATGSVIASITVDDTNVADANDTAADIDTLTPQADLSITKTDGVTAVQPGEELTYTIVATNAGPSDTSGNVGDTLLPILQDASWTCVGSAGGSCTAAGTGDIDDIADLPAGASATYTLTATVDPDADGSEIVANAADVQTTPGVDTNAGNDAALDVDQVADFTADLVALKAAPASAVVGGTISYTIGVRNDGPDLARDVVLDDVLPTGTTFVSMTQTTGPAATLLTPAVGAGGTVEASWGSFPDGATAEFTVVVQLGASIEIGDAVVNTAAVESFDEDDVVDAEVTPAATIDPVDANNDITVTTVIVAQATTTTTTTSTTLLATTSTTARVGSGALARTGAGSGGPVGTGVMIVGAGLVLVGAAELRRRRATM